MSDFPHFIQTGKQPAVEHFGPGRPGKSILIRFAGLNKTQFNTLVFGPIGQML